MKDIKKEVDALEVAMQVATDIKDKPYAYAVARIQEAILGNSSVEEVRHKPLKSSEWSASITAGLENSSRIWISKEGLLTSSLLVRDTELDVVKQFCIDLLSLEKTGKSKMRWSIGRDGYSVSLAYSHGATLPEGHATLIAESKHAYKTIDALSVFLNDTQPWN